MRAARHEAGIGVVQAGSLASLLTPHHQSGVHIQLYAATNADAMIIIIIIDIDIMF